jgi:aminoglycoside/choline kinase family phosphotransferase
MNEQRLAIIHTLLHQAGHLSEWKTLTPLSGDGSDRPFFRLDLSEQSLLAVFPSPTMGRARAEAHSTFLIGRHLWHSGVPVPEIKAYDQQSGAILFEDLGNRLLFHEVQSGEADRYQGLYQQAVTILADFQLGAKEGFQADWCWDTQHYDRELMITRESNYFAREFCLKYLGLPDLPIGLADEFSALAERISQCPASHLIHRDYQSRNLMVVEGKLKVIDFQGARFGPLAYDLASLLNDPYVTLSDGCKQGLVRHYLERAGTYISLDPDRFMLDYHHIALQRNLQVLGAYAFLVQERGKEFFRQYIDPALQRLLTLLANTLAGDYPVLYGLVDQIAGKRTQDASSALSEARSHTEV